jgi:hypothetical protein
VVTASAMVRIGENGDSSGTTTGGRAVRVCQGRPLWFTNACRGSVRIGRTCFDEAGVALAGVALAGVALATPIRPRECPARHSDGRGADEQQQKYRAPLAHVLIVERCVAGRNVSVGPPALRMSVLRRALTPIFGHKART